MKKTHYYSVATKHAPMNWYEETQKELVDTTWEEAYSFCQMLANAEGSNVRLCESKGYNNQGHYIHPTSK
jgi:hypothetical protein